MIDNPVSDLRTRLLESALSIVSEKGAGALTVRAVAKAAGCSTMGVYTHFSGKSGLIDAIVDSGLDDLGRQLARAWERAEAGRDGLVAVAEAYRDWGLASPTQFQTMFAPSIAGYEPSDSTVERLWETFYAHRARVASVLDSADSDPAAWHQTAMAMWSCVHGHVCIEQLRRTHATSEIAAGPSLDLGALIDSQIAAAAVAA
ncbi:TetR/AcrR family transcriptional regulator [Demequina mangrovi]|uniref:Transcriptional regulator, TetR family n=1 Tax=Demequina mangrovi TaxID=1043493 RepID=A0A1H6WGD7_9MICO|nr:TetR/AcrR family transcriptional regulator [Demequina mangrovi]SEJ11860.1 transcriptional regulator, TetR family [Demequina mangrovi]